MDLEIIKQLRRELIDSADEKTLAVGQRFFKEQVKFYGVKTSLVSKIAKDYFSKIKGKSKPEIFKLCEELLKSDYNEEAWIAFEWSAKLYKSYELQDFKTFESWLEKYVNNWAKCDTFCNHSIGLFIEKYPNYLEDLKKWAKSGNLWVRRGSAVSLILPARKGMFLNEIFEIADILLLDQEDLVQKGYGWMLKEASRKHEKEVFEYILKNKKIMPRTALRYAIEKMPLELRRKAMAK